MTPFLIFTALQIFPGVGVDVLVFGKLWWKATFRRWQRGF